MPNYYPFLGNDGNYYYRRHADGIPGTSTLEADTLSSSFSTLAALRTAIQAAVFTDTGYSEVQVG